MAREGGAGIKDVAREAGVSVGTVSNVLNKPSTVSEAKRRRVLDAISELGYVPNNAARQLKAGVSRAVGLVVVDTSNPFYGSIALAAEEAAEEQGLGLFVANSHRRVSKEQYYLSQFEQQRARGILVTPGAADLSQHRAVAARGTRVVLVDSVEPEPDFCTVSADDFHGGRLAMQHLLDLGRKRITILGGPGHYRQIGRRRAGALSAAEGAGVEVEYVEPPEMSILAGRALGEQVLSGPDRPDAIFAMNDLLATGVLQSLVMGRSLEVPSDIALIGYDDIDFCESAVVPITSVRQPAEELGREALQLLEAEILEGEAHEHRDVVHQPRLVVRASTAGRAAL
ncbi:LacI family DNA-binding transcriptional regulator [Tessaracoccus rhinocerotis]|uniref:LacI family DNA-binding transcriptional regulator n=1 Tax=Tessaracoccus rhinocerotis TaxID=1689449 RepID=UPI001FE2C714|nr:LacI family DNA-binding transcriptional regulator [Tessaracoccus rhinocerotis]